MKSHHQTTKKSFFQVVLFITLLMSICFGLTSTIDYFLAPRFAALSFGLLILSLSLLFNREQKIIKVDIIVILFCSYFLFYLLSYFQAICKSEALFSIEKTALILILFIFLLQYFKLQTSDKMLDISKLLVIIFAIFFITSLSQLFKLKSNDYISIYKISSLSGHKNFYSCFLFLCIPFFIYGNRLSTKYWKQSFSISLLLILVSILYLQTRAVWLGLFVSTLLFSIFIIFKKKDKSSTIQPKKLVFLLVILFVSFSSSIAILHYFNHLEMFLARLDFSTYSATFTVGERLLVWEKTIALIKDHFWLGVGAGNWPFEYLRYSIGGIMEAMSGSTFQRPHNDFLWIWAETGVFGWISFVLLFGLPIAISIRKCIKEPYSQDNTIELLFTCILVGFLVISFFDFPKERIELLTISTLILAFIHANNIKHFKSIVEIKLKPLLFIVFPIILLCCVTAIYRIKGEKYTVKIYKAKVSQNSESMIKNCDRAMSFFYEVDPASMPLSWYKGIAFTQTNNYENGCEEFDKAYQLSRYNHIINNNMGVCKLRNGNTDEAKKFFEESIRINPVYDEPKLNLVVIYFNEKKYEKALEYANMADTSLQRTKRYLDLIQPLVKN